MKKIRLTAALGNYPKGTEFSMDERSSRPVVAFTVTDLLEDGYAEEITDDVDIEAIRKNHVSWSVGGGTTEFGFQMSEKDIAFVGAYFIVKAVIDQLNGDFKIKWSKDNNEDKYHIYYDWNGSKFVPDDVWLSQFSILPYCKDKKTAQRVIELCDPELKVLFGVR